MVCLCYNKDTINAVMFTLPAQNQAPPLKWKSRGCSFWVLAGLLLAVEPLAYVIPDVIRDHIRHDSNDKRSEYVHFPTPPFIECPGL